MKFRPAPGPVRVPGVKLPNTKRFLAAAERAKPRFGTVSKVGFGNFIHLIPSIGEGFRRAPRAVRLDSKSGVRLPASAASFRNPASTTTTSESESGQG